MRLARIATPDGPRDVVERDGAWREIRSMFDRTPFETGESHPLDGVTLLSPVEPRVVLGMLHNTGAADRELPPQAFQKTARTVVGPGDPILIDPRRGVVKGEGELALVVRKEARDVDLDRAADFILGWTIGNDVTAVDQLPFDDKMTQAKNGDGFTPLGPWIETDLDALDAAIAVTVDGESAAGGSSADLARSAAGVLVYVTSHLTLGAGDVILTGAPNTACVIQPGNEMAITIPGIGTLTNPVRAREVRAR